MDSLRLLLSQNQRDRIAEELAAQNQISDPSLLRHTTYQGDRKIQQLGGEIIDNGIVLNNQSLAIGDVVMPLTNCNVLRRVDSTNGGALLGTAYRDAVEQDVDANGNRRDSDLSRNGGGGGGGGGGQGGGGGRGSPSSSPPPYGCTPPPPQCFWTTNPIAPDGFQNHGDAVVNENAVPLYLHCIAGTAVSPDLNCEFLSRWRCVSGICVRDPNGIYNSQAECEASRSIHWRGYLTTFYNGVAPGFCSTPTATNLLVAEGIISQSQSPVTAVIDNITSPTPGCPGKNHYAFIDALGNRLAFVPGSADSAYVQQNFTC